MKQQTKIVFSVGTAFALALTAGASFIPIPFTNAPVVQTNVESAERKTSFAREAVQPFVDAGRTHGMVTVLVNGSQTETDCIGWADVGKRRPITLDAHGVDAHGVCPPQGRV